MRISDWSSVVCSSDLRRSTEFSVPWPFPGPRHKRPTPAGLLARGSSLDARLPGIGPSGCAGRNRGGDRKSAVEGKRVSEHDDRGGRRIIKKKNHVTSMLIVVPYHKTIYKH